MIDKKTEINQLTGKLVNIAFHIHQSLGPGLFESVYEEVMVAECKKYPELYIERQKAIPITWDGKLIDRAAFKADIIVNKTVLLELKSIDAIAPIHYKQVETYLRLSGLQVGLLINFNEVLFKNGIRRIANKI